MLKMRTIEQAAQVFKESDPGTALTSHAIRRIVKNGKIHSVRVGAKYLVSLEELERFLKGENADER